MNKKITLIILLLCFTFSSSLFALKTATNSSVNIELSMENKIDEEGIDKLDMFFETSHFLNLNTYGLYVK